jgi:serine-type D-Ala-D-Ala carboxypeptidase/endopeptidase
VISRGTRALAPLLALSTLFAPAFAAQPDFSRVDAILSRAPARIGSGCALLVVADGKVVYRRAVGGFSPERVVPIASASKWLAGAVMLSLADEGKISLDDPVARHLPEFRRDKSAITIRQLFSHTSGLPAEARCRNDRSTSLEACVARIAGMSPRSPPGKELFYGGVAMHVAGRAAEVVSGRSWNDLFLERIARPLELSKTDFFAYGPTRNPRPAGDARSSLDEYGRFLAMLLARGVHGGRRVLSERAVEEIGTDQTRGVPIAYSPLQKLARFDPRFPRARYGVGVFRLEDGALVSPGALGAFPWMDAGRRHAGFLITRNTFSRVAPVWIELKEAVAAALAQAP